MPISTVDIVIAEGAEDTGSLSMEEWTKRGLPFFAGCQVCAASLGPDQSYPGKGGFILCRDCIGDHGYETVEDFRKDYPAMETVTIWKYSLSLDNSKNTLDIPGGSTILDVQVYGRAWEITMWALVVAKNPTVKRTFVVVGTGNSHASPIGVYIGTVQSPPFVWHIFETTTSQR